MSSRALFGALIVGAVAVMVFAGRRHDRKAVVPAVTHAHERPWLSLAAIDEIVRPHGALGPLFADLSFGMEVAPETRARIAAFARENDVEIDLDVTHHELAAIRFAVTFGGCCGYEAADRLGTRLDRPQTDECEGCQNSWIDDWVFEIAGQHGRAKVHVNRVEIRWEADLTIPELLDRAEATIGRTRASLREAAGDRWDMVDADHDSLEIPYPFNGDSPYQFVRPPIGFTLAHDHGKVSEVAFDLLNLGDPDELEATLRKRWGKPHVTTNENDDNIETWRVQGNTVEVTSRSYRAAFSIRR